MGNDMDQAGRTPGEGGGETARPVSRLGPLTRRLPPPALYFRLRHLLRPGAPPPVGAVAFGSFRRLTPISGGYGFDRGLPVDRSYIEASLARRAEDVRGRVLELSDSSYTRRFGGERVTRSDVLHLNPGATFTGDLSHPDTLPPDTFDCFILTQTLQYIYDVPAAVARVLKPGGVVLATLPGITPTGGDGWRWYWSFTGHSARHCFEASFSVGSVPVGSVEVSSHGNVLAAVAFLEGLAAGELRPGELAAHDPQYPVIYTVRATKPGPA